MKRWTVPRPTRLMLPKRAGSVEICTCYDIPLEVMEDTETPLSVIVTLDGTEYPYTVG